MSEPRDESESIPGEQTRLPDSPEAEPTEGYSFFQMFFVPMMIALVLTGVILFFGLIGNEGKDVSQYLQEIKTGSQHQRWQSAYELAYLLQKEEAAASVTDADRQLALEIFDRATAEDSQIRDYLALALGQMRAKQAVPSLVKALADPSDKTRIYALMALGAIGSPESEQPVVAKLADQDAGIRKAAAFALGSIGGESARTELKKSLHDPVVDVSWNCALSLARMGDDSGREQLLVMADRDAVRRATADITETQVADVLESAAHALGLLKMKDGVPALLKLAQTDPDHKVRAAASASLEAMGAS